MYSSAATRVGPREVKRTRHPSSEADYVVVGAGSAGCIVAARLAETGARVILLESGGTDNHIIARWPGVIGAAHVVPFVKKRIDWGYVTSPQRHLDGRRIPHTRGRMLGGSGSVNGMVWVRGNRLDYDSWAAEGNAGWSADDVNTLYQRIEDFAGGADAYRGVGGPIKIAEIATAAEPVHEFVAATARTTGTAVLDDYNGRTQEGAGIVQQNAWNRLRYSSSRGYLHNKHLPTLLLQTGTQVLRIVVNNGAAVGVEVRDSTNGVRTITAAAEVVLCAGAIGSPHLLMLSGIGPASHLAAHSIDVIADLPVGDNLHDHPFLATTWHVPRVGHHTSAGYFSRAVARELTGRRTFLASSMIEATAFLRSAHVRNDAPDLQLMTLPWPYPTPNQDNTTDYDVDDRPCLTVLAAAVAPRSRGTVRLASPDPDVHPVIDFAYLAEPADLDVLVEGVDVIRAVMAESGMAESVRSELTPGAGVTGARLRVEARRRMMTTYHATGTCRMGVDESAVVTPSLEVRGIDRLRVADASVMPTITTGNTNAPAMMIGEKCAELIANPGPPMSSTSHPTRTPDQRRESRV